MSKARLIESAIAKITRKVMNEEHDPKNDKIGVKLSQMCEWDGVSITEAYLAALTDANFHSERKKLAPVLSKIFGAEFEGIG